MAFALLLTGLWPGAAQAKPKNPAAATGVYLGRPDLALMRSLVEAGGGAADYHTTTLLDVLAGSKTDAELVSLTKKFGAAGVKTFVVTFDFIVTDSLEQLAHAELKLTADPDPDPKDGDALLDALNEAGTDRDDTFTVAYLLDHVVSHPVRVAVVRDTASKYGAASIRICDDVLSQLMDDLDSDDKT